MKIIVDTNIVFSAIINTNGRIGDLLFNSSGIFEFYSVHYLRTEISRHHSKLVQISGLTSLQIQESATRIMSNISFVEDQLIPFEIWQESIPVVKDVDMDDVAFIALSKYLKGSIVWSGNKKLINGVRAKGFRGIVSTYELHQLRLDVENALKK